MTAAGLRHDRGRRLLLALALTLGIGATTPAIAETGPDPDGGSGSDQGATTSPRVAIEIAGVSVVLVSANGKLYAFADRLEDNAPASDADITVVPDGRPPQVMAKVANGLFVTPFDRAGLKRSVLAVSLKSKDGSGQGTAELVFDEATPGKAASGVSAVIALVVGGIGIAVAALMVGRRWPIQWPAPATAGWQDLGRRIQRFRAHRRTSG